MKKLPLHVKIIIGLILGFVWALLSINFDLNGFTKNWIAPFGTIFINLLKMIAVPLVLFSIIAGVANLGDPKKLGKLGMKTIALYMTTTVIAISVGLTLVNIFAPGSPNKGEEQKQINNRLKYETWARQNNVTPPDGVWYLDKAEYSNNTVASDEATSDKVKRSMAQIQKQKEQSPLQFIVDMVPSNAFQAITDNKAMLKIIFFAIFFGISMASIAEKYSAPVLKIVKGIDEIFLKMVESIMAGAPYFVFALVAGEFSKLADNSSEFFNVLKGLSTYALVVFGGLLTMVFVVYPLMMKLFVKSFSYKKFFEAISPAQTLAFSTSSSAATLPVTMECVEKNLKVRPRTTSFVLPIGATINMDGSSLYIAVAVVFLAQFHLVDLSFMDQMTILFTSALASIGTAAVPSASIVMMMIVLQTVGLNPAWIAIIMPFDRILDMCRTTVNVTGDTAVCSVVDHLESDDE